MFENKIVSYGVISPEEVLANPRNFKIHTKMQQSMMQGILEEVGFVSPIIINQRTGFLVDGHMRVILSMRQNVQAIPCVNVDLTEEEEMKALALYDYVTSKAGIDKQKMQELILELGSNSEVMQMLSTEMFPQKKTLERIKQIPKLEKDEIAEIQSALGLNEETLIPWAKGIACRMGESVLICADPVNDLEIYYPYLDVELPTKVIPWGSIYCGLSSDRMIILQPDVEICKMILSFYIKAFGVENVIQYS